MVVPWNRGRQLLILLWKNFLLQVRRPIGTVIELIVPPGACVVLIILKFLLFEVEHRCHLTFDADPLTLPVPFTPYNIYYSPNTSQAAKEIATYLTDQESYWNVVGVASEDELVYQLTTHSPPHPPITLTNEINGVNITQEMGCFLGGAGIVFDNLDGDEIEYTLRLRHEVGELDTWHTSEAAFWFQTPGARVTDNVYLAEGFLHIQNRVAQAIINWKTANITTTPHVHVAMKQIPYPSYRIDAFLNWNAAILPLLLIMAFIYSAGMFTKELVLEKETRIRESMLMMGLQQWVLWTTWFIKQFVFLLVSTVMVTLLLKFGQVFPESNIFLLLLFFTLFATASISWCFFISVWFSSARLGMIVAFVAWFFIYIPFFYVPQNYHAFPLSAKLAMCVLTNTCMGIGVTLVSEWEVRQQGLTLDTLLKPLTIEDGFHMGWVLVMLFADTIFFMLVAWYVNGVKPGRYGVPRPFYFPLQPSYWTGRSCRANNTDVSASGDDTRIDDLHEEEPQDMTVGISIQNLIKIYDDSKFSKCWSNTIDGESKRKLAVDGLSLNMYEGQITALLGHNGAGKTTTISILTGLYTPTSGTAIINGYDIRSNMDQIRHSLGICPQHNILFDRLTVREHLKFFARLKGVHGRSVQEATNVMINDLQLEDKTNTPSRNLSGGMKRKLSVGIALIGGSKIVVLDEPTSGMDPYARRATWDLLAKHKEGRTILLTTHFMDEADLLGDRIAIMADGKLHCSGSSLFLKSRYGVGYHMVIVKEPSCDTAKVCDLVLGSVPGSQVVTDVGAELSFILPSAATQHFPSLFDTLEAEQEGLGISSYGISVTTMEEVFMKVRDGADKSILHRIKQSGTPGTLSLLSLTSLPLNYSLHVSNEPPPTHEALQSNITQEQHMPVLTIVAEIHDRINSVESVSSTHHENSRKESNRNEEIDFPTVEVVEENEMFPNERYPKMYGVSWSQYTGQIGDERKCGAGRNDDVMDDVISDSESSGRVNDDRSVGSSGRCDDMLEIDGVPSVGEETREDDGINIELPVMSEENQAPDKEVSLSVPVNIPLEVSYNKGLCLWLQKYRAMLVKRMYNSIRFWKAMVTQLFLPLLFVLYAMVLATTILFTDNASDPKRRLSISSSALSSSNQTLFWAEFDGMEKIGNNLSSNTSSFFDLTNKTLMASLGATDIYDYSSLVLDLLSTAVHRGQDTAQCCDYHYQMLDKYCASRTVEELGAICNHIISFPYHHCPKCLSCCTSQKTRLPSCTHPLTQNTNYEESQFCPSSPQISLQDLLNNSITGPFDTYTAYMDEVLMLLSHDISAPVFTRRVMGGFMVQHRRDPPYTTCRCSTATEGVCQNAFKSLYNCGASNSSRPIYVAPLPHLILNQSEFCPVLESFTDDGSVYISDIGSGMREEYDSVQFQSGYEVDGLGADFLKAGVCEFTGDASENIGSGVSDECKECEGGNDDMVSAQYYQETEDALSVTVWYNNWPWHMSAASLNAFHNVWLRQATSNPDFRLTVNNHPLPRTNLKNLVDAQQVNLDGYYVGITIVFGYSFLVASFCLVLVAEKETKAKHLQFVSGVDVTSFWLANLTWDMLNSLLPVGLSVAIIAASQVEAYTGHSLLAIACTLFLTCWCSIPLVYTVSFLFTNSLVAFGIIFVFFFLSCLNFFLVILVISDGLLKDTLHYLFLLNPSYTLGIGMNDIYINHFLKTICTFTPLAEESCEMNDIRYVDNLFSLERPGIAILLIYMAIEGLVFFILTLIIERHFFTKELSKLHECRIRRKRRKWRLEAVNSVATLEVEMKPINQPTTLLEIEDSDVLNEAEKVMNGHVDSNSVIIIKNLVKVYPRSLDGFKMRPAKSAVQGISLAIPTGECFGLLGVNGAGKTTTFNILIGDISPTSGTAIISGYDIRTDLRKVRQVIGYCPQFDALIERMTGRELLTMFARLRGIPERLISQAVKTEVNRLDLTKHASKQCGKYSGGNKRKLSTAIALIGNPPIILLDEPTTGMDPTTRRYLWDVLTGVTREGRSIVLTTHSMEECEALCTRLAIMVNGQFKCLGSIQHLKSKYGSGYSLQAKVKHVPDNMDHTPSDIAATSSPRRNRRGKMKNNTSSIDLSSLNVVDQFNTTELHTFINETFPGAILLEEHQGAVTYQLCNDNLRWATVFREMGHHRERLGVTDYSVSQTTLEQVFINFAKDQKDVEDNMV